MSPKGYRSAYEKQWVGIDVCQKYLDVYLRPSNKLFQVTNDEVGISQFVQTLKKLEPELIVLEATGGMLILLSNLSMNVCSKKENSKKLL